MTIDAGRTAFRPPHSASRGNGSKGRWDAWPTLYQGLLMIRSFAPTAATLVIVE